MAEYRVIWEIDVDADNHVDAARKAREMQRDPFTSATCYDVSGPHPRKYPSGTESASLKMIDLSDQRYARQLEGAMDSYPGWHRHTPGMVSPKAGSGRGI